MAGLKIYVRRQGSTLVPATSADEDAIRALPLDKVLRADIVRQRSAEQNAFYWVLCAKVAAMLNDMGDDTATKDNVSDRFKIATGNMTLAVLSPRLQILVGERYAAVPGTIAFHKMDQSAFNEFMDRVTAFTLTELLPHMPTKELRRQISDMLVGVDRGAAA